MFCPRRIWTTSRSLPRRKAARKHGVDAFKAHGESALEKPQRSRLQELKDSVQSREGTINLMRDNAANAMMVTELVLSHISKKVKQGYELESIAGFSRLPGFMNTAQRALRDLVTLYPDDPDILDARDVLKSMKHGQEDD